MKPELSIFVIALRRQLDKVKLLCNQIFFYASITPLPLIQRMPETKNGPTKEEIEKLTSLSRDYTGEMLKLAAFIHDYEIDAQNELLRGIFEGRATRRVPKNNRGIVITSRKNDREKILSYFGAVD